MERNRIMIGYPMPAETGSCKPDYGRFPSSWATWSEGFARGERPVKLLWFSPATGIRKLNLGKNRVMIRRVPAGPVDADNGRTVCFASRGYQDVIDFGSPGSSFKPTPGSDIPCVRIEYAKGVFQLDIRFCGPFHFASPFRCSGRGTRHLRDHFDSGAARASPGGCCLCPVSSPDGSTWVRPGEL